MDISCHLTGYQATSFESSYTALPYRLRDLGTARAFWSEIAHIKLPIKSRTILPHTWSLTWLTWKTLIPFEPYYNCLCPSKKKVLFSNLGAPNSLKSGIVFLCKPLCHLQPLLQAFELVVLIFHSPRVCYDSSRSESESLKNCSAINAAPQALEAKKIHGPTKGILRSNRNPPIHQKYLGRFHSFKVKVSEMLASGCLLQGNPL